MFQPRSLAPVAPEMCFSRNLTFGFSLILCWAVTVSPVFAQGSGSRVPVEQSPGISPSSNNQLAVPDQDLAAQKMPVDENGMIPTPRAIKMMEERVTKNPRDYVSLAILGQLLMRDAKERDDHQSYVAAEVAFEQAIAISPQAKAAHVYLIAALQAQHKFQDALAQSRIALDVVPGNLVAIASRGDAELELGNIQAAEKSFNLVAEQAQTPGVLARLARIAELKGRSGDSIKLLEQAREKSFAAGERPQTTAWYDFRIGMLQFGEGNLAAAEQAYQSGIQRYPDDTRSIDGLAEVKIAQQDLKAADSLYRRSLAIMEAPPTLAKLGDLLEQMGQQAEAKRFWDRTEALMKQEAESTGVAHYRERALFLLDHDRDLKFALDLAKQDLEQRQDIYSHGTLAWALYKNDQIPAALEESNKSLQAGVRDAKLYFQAGMIAAKAGDRVAAIEHLEKSLNINPHFDPVSVKLAKSTLATLKQASSQAGR